MRIALFPGTFDPFTNGHLDIVEKGLGLFDQVVVAVGENASKKTMFDLETRMKWISKCFENEPRVKVTQYSGLTIQFCNEVNATFILRGLRTIGDFEYEKQIAMVNADLDPSVQSVFVLSEQKYTAVSSTVIRDLILHGGNYAPYLPKAVTIDVKPV
ncbi:MAG: pantetheine-phosphate adenylyltransferase [Bacteroidetes bacterium]|mgnify:FL=1|jgi:pantetheine-phosphate adenylyltransferase|nr:pantetheine-phosphate adenylyltransferase [Bacteroidota bacterium]